MTIYDYVTADSVEVGDQVLISNDPIEVTGSIDDGEAIMLHGYSHMTGDSVTYMAGSDDEVGLWGT